ncbi:MAG TPA: carboxypeptidase regulatory-like domain-containing protein [Terriglobia bacterium]|nr:carboxypeptidase regulatory-like domain-containing protein [Terriglobia bacterium]
MRRRTDLQVLVRAGTGIIGLIVLGSCLIFGQGSTAAISGLVRDATGAVVPGATVTARHIDSGLTRTAVSSENGGYNVQFLPVGAYELMTDMPGFKQQMRRGINLVVGQEAIVNLTLEVGAPAELVTVTDEAPIVNTTLSSTSGLINESQIKDLPLNGRSFDQLLTLNVGTVDNRSNISNGAWTAFSVAGKRPETNRFLMNGVDYIGSNGAGSYITPSGSSGQLLGVEAVREYNVLQHTYGAEYGKRAGAQVTVVSSSGTNQLHGDLFEYMRNSALDARNFFEDAKGPFNRNQFGGALGGPLKKDKAFLFGNYEGFRERWGVPSAAIVPDAQARQGFLPNAAGVYVPVLNLEPRMLPYANYFWPAPNGPEILLNGLPTGSAYAYSNPKRKVREDFGLLRFDYTHSTKDSFYVNFNADDGSRVGPQTNTVFRELSRQRSYLVGLQETHIVSTNIVNSATLGFSRTRGTQVVVPAAPIPSNLVFLTGTNPGSITIGGSAITVVAAAFAPANGNSPNRDTRNYATWSDDVRITKGNHSWSAGVWIQRIQQNIYGVPQATAGSVSYSTLLSFLQDQPTQFIANPNPQPLYFRSTEGAWYVQDEMKLTQRLTLRLGLRDEMTNGWNEAHGHASNYIYVNDVIQTEPRIGSSSFLENNAKALWQPRVGLAWDPTGTGRWSVRAGFGIHHDLQDNLGHRLNANAPFNSRLTVTGLPLLSIVPIPFGKELPPSCNSQSPLRPPDCSVFVAGGVDPVMKTPTLQQWSLTVERGITKDLMLQLSYVGSEGYHILTGMSRNTARPQVCSDPAGCLSGGIRPANQAVRVPQGTTYMPSTPPVGVPPAQLQMRPNPFVGSTLSWFYNGTNSYQSGNVSLTKRSTRGLTFKGNYTFAKILDINSAILAASATNEPANVVNPFDLKLSRGLASYNLKHQFNANFLYPLPIGSGRRFGGGGRVTDKLFGGWQWSGALNIQSGFPFTPQVGSNSSGTGDTLIPDVPNRNPDFKGPVILGKVDHWFDPRAFLLPPAGTFGNVARGLFTGPGLWNLDTSLAKRFSVTEQVSMQFRAEAFNVFNHTNFTSPNPVVFSGNNYSSSAGAITSTSTASRQIQFALKLLF